MQKRIWNLALVCLSYVYRLIRGGATVTILSEPRSFIVINPTGNIGDMVCTTPVFHAIKEKYPTAHLTVVGASKNGFMMEGNTDIDTYISLNGSLFETVREIRKRSYDAGIVINPSTLDFATLFLSNVKNISSFVLAPGFTQYEARMYKIISKLGHRIVYTPGTYVPGQYLTLLSPFNIISNRIEKHLGYTDEGKKNVIQKLRDHGIQEHTKLIAIAPGAGTKVKQWPAERFGKVANYLYKKYGLATIIIGGPRDLPESETMIAAFETGTPYCNCVGQSLDELKAVLSEVSLIIGNDSGPIYIAESFGAATIVLVGPTDETEHPLQDMTHRVVMSTERGEALLQSGVSAEDTIDIGRARAQIEAITVEEVCAEIDDVFKNMKIEVKG